MSTETRKPIEVRFRCGHLEKLTAAQIKRQGVFHTGTFTINDRLKAESGQYCAACCKPFTK